MPYGSKDEYYEAGNSQEPSMGRKKNKKVHRGGAGSRRQGPLGSGMASRAAGAIRRRQRMLQDL